MKLDASVDLIMGEVLEDFNSYHRFYVCNYIIQELEVNLFIRPIYAKLIRQND